MRKCFAVLTLLTTLFAAAPLRAQTTSDGPALARQTLDALHMTEAMRAALPNIIDIVQKKLTTEYPQYSEQINNVIPRLRVKFQSHVDEMIGIAADTLARRFSSAELSEIRDFAVGTKDPAAQAAFRNSPTGTKFRAMLPDFSQEMKAAGERWGAKLGQEVDDEIKAELRRQGRAL